MHNQEFSNPMINDLQKANKYIFVQDFAKADKTLQALCAAGKDSYEPHFRRIEIASKTGEWEPLMRDLLQGLAGKQNWSSEPDDSPFVLAYILACLKYVELSSMGLEKSSESKKSIEIVRTEPSKNPIPLPRGKWKFDRQPLCPDDTIVRPSVRRTLGKEADFLEDLQPHVRPMWEERAALLYAKYPKNYAVCYVMAFVLEGQGRLTEAIEVWREALRLNPQSMVTLSILTELQQKGYLPKSKDDFGMHLELLDKYLVHGHLQTHTDLYQEFLQEQDYDNAMASLRILSDWLYHQYGSVPIEIEALCVLGCRSIFALQNNAMGVESCENEIENLIFVYKTGDNDLEKLYDVGNLCEEYGAVHLAKKCYGTILTCRKPQLALALRVAKHCQKKGYRMSLVHQFKVAFENSPHCTELRQHVLSCLSQRENPDRNARLAEKYLQQQDFQKAEKYFDVVVKSPYADVQDILNYARFLGQKGFYEKTLHACKKGLAKCQPGDPKINDFYELMAQVAFARSHYELAAELLEKGLSKDPWHGGLLGAYLQNRVHTLEKVMPFEKAAFFGGLQNILGRTYSNPVKHVLFTYGHAYFKKGYHDMSWSFAKACFLLTDPDDALARENAWGVLARAGSVYDDTITVPEVLQLLGLEGLPGLSFFDVALCVAHLYRLCGKWALLGEWVLLAKKFCPPGQSPPPLLLELEARYLLTTGAHCAQTAQRLLEAAIEARKFLQQDYLDALVLCSYTLSQQGKTANSMAYLEHMAESDLSLENLYFIAKCYEGADRLSDFPKAWVEHLNGWEPTNAYEQQLVEELFFTMGLQVAFQPMGLAC